jgi:hypothetical protein
MKILLDPFDEAERLSVKSGQWIVAGIETRVFWPTKRQMISFDGKEFVLIPIETKATYPSLPGIAINASTSGLSSEEARKAVLRFASALSWRERSKVEVVMWGGGNLPRPMGLIRNSGRSEYLDS